MYCTSCGTLSAGDAKFCNNCGATLGIPPDQTLAPTPDSWAGSSPLERPAPDAWAGSSPLERPAPDAWASSSPLERPAPDAWASSSPFGERPAQDDHSIPLSDPRDHSYPYDHHTGRPTPMSGQHDSAYPPQSGYPTCPPDPFTAYQNQQQPGSGYPPTPGHMPPYTPVRHSDPSFSIDIGVGSFAEKLHSFGRSSTFMIGATLYTVGGVVSGLINFTFFNVFSLGLLALPIIALWMIYMASSQPRLPEKTITALTLFKVSAIIQLVFVGIAAAGVLIGLIVGGIAAAIVDPLALVIFLIVAVIIIGFFAMYIYLYFVSIFRILAGIKSNLTGNVFTPLRGVTPLMVIVVITSAFSIIGGLITMVASPHINVIFNDLIWAMPHEVQSIMRDVMPMFGSGTMMFSMFMSILSSIGIVMCVSVLNSFNNTLKQEAFSDFGGPSPLESPPMQW